MTNESTTAPVGESSSNPPLRLWPGVLAVVVQWVLKLGVPIVAPAAAIFGMLGALALGIVVVLWWLFASRAAWSERLLGVGLMVVSLLVARLFLHESLASLGMGVIYFVQAVPLLSLAFVTWAVVTRNSSLSFRRLTMAATILLACGFWVLFRTDGMDGAASADFSFRWTPSAEEKLLDQEATRLATAAVSGLEAGEAEWPGFRGPARDGVVRGVKLATDWEQTPPRELWRRAIGPGWSSFAVAGDLLYTQEQRGEEEVVSAYARQTGEPVWRHVDEARFWEAVGGAGPRATPTLLDGRVYALGATGKLNVLDAVRGDIIWSRDIVQDTGAKVPGWGFASSPLIYGDAVVVAAAGQLVAYSLSDGALRWTGETSTGYSSPHLMRAGGTNQLLMLSSKGLRSVVPEDGSEIWRYEWKGEPIIQPTLLDDGDVLVTTAGANGSEGLSRLRIARQAGGGWQIEELWNSNRLKPYFNDIAVYEGHAYGFDGSIMASIDLEDGSRNWKGGRYGHGQLVLVQDSGVLLVLTEEGDLALVAASPDGFDEIAKVPAIEGKTWNHPVLIRDLLYVRNGEEMVAFQLPLQST